MRNHEIIAAVLLSGLVGGIGCERGPGAQDREGAEVQTELQYAAPIRAIDTYLHAFHFYNGDIEEQVEAHHYVTPLDGDRMQALIYDGNTENARLIGVEYIISARLFDQLPPEEKKLWHSHVYEVKSGLAISPGLPESAERALMTRLTSSYGKTWHTWHTHRHGDVPMGIPALMMAFTADGQIDPERVAIRDQRFGVDSAAIAAKRADIAEPDLDPLADIWEEGEVIQLRREVIQDARIEDEEIDDQEIDDEEMRGEEMRGEEMRGEEMPGEEMPDEVVRGEEMRGEELRDEELQDEEMRDEEMRDEEILE